MAKLPKVKEVRAYVQSTKCGGPTDQGADCHDVEDEHWINGFPVPIATPMSHYGRYRRCGRKAWGINALGSVVAEVEAESGATGVGAHVVAYTAWSAVQACLHVVPRDMKSWGLHAGRCRGVHRRRPGLLPY